MENKEWLVILIVTIIVSFAFGVGFQAFSHLSPTDEELLKEKTVGPCCPKNKSCTHTYYNWRDDTCHVGYGDFVKIEDADKYRKKYGYGDVDGE